MAERIGCTFSHHGENLFKNLGELRERRAKQRQYSKSAVFSVVKVLDSPTKQSTLREFQIITSGSRIV